MFILVTLISLTALVLALAFHRYRKLRLESGYLDWLWKQTSRFFKSLFSRRPYDLLRRLDLRRHPAGEKWVLLCFVASFVFLALSGFGYAFFSRRGIHGYPLLFHVFAGGLYAVSLCLVVILRAKRFAFNPGFLSPEIDFSRVRGLSVSSPSVQRVLFWIFVLAGFLLIVSALGSMLPLLYFDGQKAAVEVHRYSALGSVLVAAVFSYLILVDQRSS